MAHPQAGRAEFRRHRGTQGPLLGRSLIALADVDKGALLAGCLTSTGDWPNVLGNGQQQPWTTKTFWYAGIVCALFSVLTAAQQSMRLHRLCAHRDGLQRIRNCMMHPEVDKHGLYRPRRWRVYTWQISPILLALSVLCMIAGMAVMIWVAAGLGPLKKDYEAWWDSNAKVRPSV